MKLITFSLPIEALGDATEVILLGDFNNWNPEEAVTLTLKEEGILTAAILLEPGKTYEYRFLLNTGAWVNDWNAEAYVYKTELDIENSVITVPAEAVAKKAPATKKEKAATKGAPQKAAPKKAAAKKAAPKKATTKAITKAKEVVAKDDLTKIEGIGPKIAKLLEADGITDFKALSKASAKKLKEVLETAGPKFKVHNPASWPKQAKLAAAGDWTALDALQKELVAGK
ncbi:MAG: helix-hairpin-helix domain-containing protein [Niabella sp.]